MRLLILSQYFWPENFRINDVALEFAARGHAVTVLTGLPNYHSGRVDPAFRRDPQAFGELCGVEIVRVPLLPRGRGRVRLALNYLSFALSASLCGPWKLRRRAFDGILVFQPSPATIGLPAVVLRRLKRGRLVFWVQDLWPDTLRAVGAVTSTRLLALLQRVLNRVYRESDHVAVQSRAFLPRLERQGTGTPLSYLPNWAVEPGRMASVAAPAPRAVFKIYFTGNLGGAQDIPAVMEAVARLSRRQDIQWFFVGDGSAAGWLASEVERLGASDRVHLLGTVPASEMPRIYGDADALLLSLKPDPVFELTVPSKLQSYLASGRPILAMLDGEAARIVAEAGAGFVVPAGDAAGLADAALRLAALPAGGRRALGEAGRRYSEANFDFATLMDRLEATLSGAGTRGRSCS